MAETALIVALIIDSLVKFNKGYYSEGVLVIKRIKVFKFYLKGKFLFDTVILFVFIMSLQMEIEILKVIMLFRCLDIIKLYSELDERLRIRRKMGGIAELIELVMLIMVMAHLISCMWHSIAIDENRSGVE